VITKLKIKSKTITKLLQIYFCNISIITLILISSFITLFNVKLAFSATDYGVGRVRTCNSDGSVEGFNGFDLTSGGKEIEFSMSNPTCYSIAIATYAAVKASISAMNGVCGTGPVTPRILPSPFLDARDITKATIKAVNTKNVACGGAVSTASAAMLSSLGAIGGIHTVSSKLYPIIRICGSNWYKSNSATYTIGDPDYKTIIENEVKKISSTSASKLVLADVSGEEDDYYRQYYYNGVEIEDNPSDGEKCLDPTNGNKPQKYYFRGFQAPNFNCEKYLNNQSDAYLKAYDCCVRRSKYYICIEYDSNYYVTSGLVPKQSKRLLCRAGERCTIEGIVFQTNSLYKGSLICAETYSLCPFNFSIGGGSEQCEYFKDGKTDSSGVFTAITKEQVESGNCKDLSDIRYDDCSFNEKAGKCKNYCQYLRHCVRTSDPKSIYVSSLTSPYFSNACIDFAGDSLNKQKTFDLGVTKGKHFSAPIAQCFKESLENLFNNKIGHSRCSNNSESPSYSANARGICASGNYLNLSSVIYKKGNTAKTTSYFQKLQDNLRLAVKLVIVLSIMFYGSNLLIGKSSLSNRKEIILFVLKISLVGYFTLSNAWQTKFFSAVYNTATDFSMIFFKYRSIADEKKDDGCRFGNVTSAQDGTLISPKTGRGASDYPADAQYLAVWDTLDCKIMRYLGFGPEVTVANVASLIFAAFFTGGIGLFFALSIFIFAFLLISATIRALHIFIGSSLCIVLYVFLSPITIVSVLFEKTKNIFDAWFRDLISFCLQPIILFAYVGIFITLMDDILIGEALFEGTAKTVNCSEFCKSSNGAQKLISECTQTGDKIVNPLDSSIYCIMGFDQFKSSAGFGIFNVTVAALKGLFDDKSKTTLRITVVIRGAILLYLLSYFLDEIPGITSALIGGSSIPGASTSAVAMFSKVAGITRAIQLRLARGGLKAGMEVGQRAGSMIREIGNQGKSASASDDDSSQDQAGSSSGKSSDQAGNSGESRDVAGGNSAQNDQANSDNGEDSNKKD